MTGLPIALAAVLVTSHCDIVATIAGTIMAKAQAGASAELLAEIDGLGLEPQLVALMIDRALEAEQADDPDLRELTAFHFAWQVYHECAAPTS